MQEMKEIEEESEDGGKGKSCSKRKEEGVKVSTGLKMEEIH
jgi:hypothetical protein